VMKFSAGGFRDFTRIAASDPIMWRDVFLANKEAVLEMLGTFNEDLSKLTRAIRRGDGEALFEHFTRTRAIRRGIVEIGQDSAVPDFGRPTAQLGNKPELKVDVVSSPPPTRVARGGEGSGVGGGAAYTEAAVPADRPPTPDPSQPLRGGRGEADPIQ